MNNTWRAIMELRDAIYKDTGINGLISINVNPRTFDDLVRDHDKAWAFIKREFPNLDKEPGDIFEYCGVVINSEMKK